jgi:hypothetical protein
MIDKHAPHIVTTNGESSSEMIEPCLANASTDRADDQGPLKETAASVSKMAAVRFPLPSSPPFPNSPRKSIKPLKIRGI